MSFGTKSSGDQGTAAWANIIEAALGSGEPAQSAAYIMYKSGSNYKARDGTDGKIDYSGTDAATVIQAAIDATPDGSAVYLKKARYDLTAGLDISTRVGLIGECPAVTSDGSLGATLYSDQAITLLTVHDNYDVRLENFGIMGNNRVADQTGILFDDASRVRIFNVLVGYINGYGVKTVNTFYDCQAIDLWVYKCGDDVHSYHALYLGAGAADFHTFNLRVTQFYYAGTYAAGNDHYFLSSQFHGDIALAKLPNVIATDGGQHKFFGCMFQWGEPQLTITSNGNVVSGNTFQSNDTTAIDITGNLNKVYGNLIAYVGGVSINGDYNHVVFNRLSGTVTRAGTGNIVYGNTHYVTENSGESIGTGAQQTIAHGLGAAPNYVRFFDKNGTDRANAFENAAANATNIFPLAVLNKGYYWEAKIV